MKTARLSFIAVCVVTLISTGSVRALEATDAAAEGDAGGRVLEEIVVTAQKRAENLHDVPLSISVATGDQFVKLGITSPADLSKIITGFTYATSTYGAPIYTIRGIGFYDEAIGIAPTVSVYVDQVPMPFSRMAEGVMLDMERVEALKGPQGTLFGQNSTGGAINYIAAKPTATSQLGGNVTYGRFGESDIEGYVSGPLSETVLARIAFRSEERGDWQLSQTRTAGSPEGYLGQKQDTSGQRNFQTSRLLLDWSPFEQLNVAVNFNGWRDTSDSQAPQFYAYSPTTPTVLDLPNGVGYLGCDSHYAPTCSVQEQNLNSILHTFPRAPQNDRVADWVPGVNLAKDDYFYQGSLRGDLALAPALTLTSISSYSRLKVFEPNDDAGIPYLNNEITVRGRISSVSEEMRLAGTAGAGASLLWMIGGNYQSDDIHDTQLIHFNSTNNGIGPYRYPDIQNISNQKVSTGAVFGSLDYKVTDTITAYGSTRYTRSNRSFDGCLADQGDGLFGQGFGFLSNLLNGSATVPKPGDPGYIGPGDCATFDANSRPVPNVHKESRERNVSWRVGASWKPTSDTLTYANITRGFKSGNFGTLPILTTIQVNQVEPEQLTAYEIGFKSSLLARKIEIEGAVFDYDDHNKQLLGYYDTGKIFGNLPAEVTIPKGRVQGAELSIDMLPVPEVRARVGITYIDSRVVGDDLVSSPVSQAPSVNINGSPYTNTPKWNFVADGEYSFPVGYVEGFVGGTATYRSSAIAVFGAPEATTVGLPPWGYPGSFGLPSYGLFDVRAGIASKASGWRLQFWIRNLADKYYWTNVSRVQDTINRETGMPRTFGVTLSGKF